MASALVGNLSQYTGEDKVYQDQIYQPDGITKQDVTGWTAALVVHKYNDPFTTFFTVIGGIVGSPLLGLLSFPVPSALTINMRPDQYAYYVKRTNVGGDTIVSVGLFSLLQR